MDYKIEKALIPNDITDYFNVTIYLGRRLGNCQISMLNQFSTPTLCIKSTRKPFFGLVSMISGGYLYYDQLTKKESILLNEFMHKIPNFHDGPDSDNGDCTNWSFMFIQYLIDYYYLYNNNKALFINENIRLFNDIDIVPNFANAYRYINIINTDQFINDLFDKMNKEIKK